MQRVQRLLVLLASLCAASAVAGVARGDRTDVTQSDVAALPANPAPVIDENQKMVDRSVSAARKTAGESTKVSAAEAQAKAALDEAISYHTKAETLINGVQQRAYFAAKGVASAEAAKLEAEAQAYYQTLVAASQALSKKGGDPRSEAAAKAAEPYVKVQLRAAAMVEAYNKKAMDTLTLARNMVGQAMSLAYQATREQAYGNAEMAQRHMMQAHMLLGQAKVKKELAGRIRQLVESLNSSIPSYQQAAENAVTHALAVFSGLQASTGNVSNDDAAAFAKENAAFDSELAEAERGPLR